MSNEIFGTDFKYTIDSSYGINKDGFIAIGTESIVYKGLKTALKGGLQFSCVLKFKPKTVPVNGEIVDRLEIFKNEEPVKEETNKKDDKEEKDDSLSSFINMISGLDVDKISDGLNGMKKILNILSEITVNDDVSSFTSARRNQRPYKRDDD